MHNVIKYAYRTWAFVYREKFEKPFVEEVNFLFYWISTVYWMLW